MASERVTKNVGRAARRVPGVRRIPVVALVAAGELVLLAREHVIQLTPAERRRLFALARTSHGRRGRLTTAEQRELAGLLNKMHARELAGDAITRLSPVPLPRRLIYGRR